MAIDFPNVPALNQIYTQGGVTYWWDGQKWMIGTGPAPPASADYVLKTGDTMSGPLTLPADPTDPLHSATKQYVDAAVSGLPLGGTPGQALTQDAASNPAWGAAIDCKNY